ncbi:MarR family transcriptional regulator [Caballeronia sp. M23-90]
MVAALLGCTKKPTDTASQLPDQPAPPAALPRDWNDDAAKAAIAQDAGDKSTYVCRFAFFDNPQLFTRAHPVDRPQIGMKKVSDTQESVEATSAQKAQEIMEAAINKSAPVGPCTADLSATSIDKSIPLSSYADLRSGSQIAVLYYLYAKEPLPVAELARSFDMDYQRTSDTFKREDLLKTLAPKYEAQQKTEAASPYLKVRLSASLGHYNPQTKSFPLFELALDGDSRLSMNDSADYAIVPRGDARFDSITPASEDQARALETKVSASGRDRMSVNVDLYVKAADVVSYATRKDVVAKVVSAHVTDELGGTIADLQ